MHLHLSKGQVDMLAYITPDMDSAPCTARYGQCTLYSQIWTVHLVQPDFTNRHIMLSQLEDYQLHSYNIRHHMEA